MVEVEGIGDSRTVASLLEGRSRKDAVCIAYRAAMRAAPIFWCHLDEAWARQRALSELSTLRALLISAVSSVYSAPDLSTSALAFIYGNADGAKLDERGATPGSYFNAAYAAFAAASTVTDDHPATVAGMAVVFSVAANISSAEEGWENVLTDCSIVEDARDPFYTPLWEGTVPQPIAAAWTRTHEDWAKKGGPVWAFWTQFYENALAGHPQDWPLLRDIALIPAEDWQGGPDRVHPIIEAMLLDRAVQATGNG